jgi:hypothetical protein
VPHSYKGRSEQVKIIANYTSFCKIDYGFKILWPIYSALGVIIVKQSRQTQILKDLVQASKAQELWKLDIDELEGKNLEVAGREEVNQLLSEGWTLLHIYTLKYREDGTWRERPMAILGRPKKHAVM